MSHTSKETIERYQFKRHVQQSGAEFETSARPEPKKSRGATGVALAIVIAAEATLFAFGFATGATIRTVSTNTPPACCGVQ